MTAEELLELRADLAAGRIEPKIEEGVFRLADYQRFLVEHADSIAAFRERQAAAFAAERAAWQASGEFDRAEQPKGQAETELELPPGCQVVEAELTASVWQISVTPGRRIAAGQPLIVLEAMKMESAVLAPADGVVERVLVGPGDQVEAGVPLVVLRSDCG